MKITVAKKTKYKPRVYPVCEKAKIFLAIRNTGLKGTIRRKTLDEEVLGNIRELGYEVEVQTPTLDSEPESL